MPTLNKLLPFETDILATADVPTAERDKLSHLAWFALGHSVLVVVNTLDPSRKWSKDHMVFFPFDEADTRAQLARYNEMAAELVASLSDRKYLVQSATYFTGPEMYEAHHTVYAPGSPSLTQVPSLGPEVLPTIEVTRDY